MSGRPEDKKPEGTGFMLLLLLAVILLGLLAYSGYFMLGDSFPENSS